MKKFLILLVFSTIILSIKAQQSVSQKEIGLTTTDFDGFGFSYMTGTNTSLWRFSTFNSSGGIQEQIQDTSSTSLRKNIAVTFKIGKEFRKLVAKNFEFRYGVDVSCKYLKTSEDYTSMISSVTSINTDNSTISPGINLVLGFNYVIKSKFVIGAELNPGMNYWFEKRESVYSVRQSGGSIVNYDESSQTSGIGYTISNTPVLFTLAYRLK